MYYNPDTKIIPKEFDFLVTNPDTIQISIDPRKKRISNDAPRAWWLYALKLEDDAYYVGITSKVNPYDRIMQHGTFLGSRWANAHKPLKVMEIRDIGYATEREAQDYEQNLTWAYMKIYGYKKVRGGSITYTSEIFKFGNHVFPSYAIKSLITGLMLIVLIWYFIYNEVLR